MTDMLTGAKSMIYDGQRNPNTFSYFVQDLKPGASYGFQVRAFNFNGAGDESEIAVFKPCTVPSNLAIPQILQTTATTMMFEWTPPANDGACSIQGYVLYVDDGAGGTLEPTDEAEMANKDYLRAHTVDFDVTQSGKNFRFQLEAFNEIGPVLSSIGNQLLASVPGKPDTDLVSDPSVTDTETIKVTWAEPTDNGGDEITSYSLEIDDGTGGDFTRLVGYEEDYLLFKYTLREGVQRAVHYRMRYRARNRIGWGEYSDIVYVLAATVPAKPPRPTLAGSDSTSITLNL